MPAFQAEMAFEGLKRRKSLGVDQITAELTLEGGGQFRFPEIIKCV
jgi:hypothetical protein